MIKRIIFALTVIVLISLSFLIPIAKGKGVISDCGQKICKSLCIGFDTEDGLPNATGTKRYHILLGQYDNYKEVTTLNESVCVGGLDVVNAQLHL